MQNTVAKRLDAAIAHLKETIGTDFMAQVSVTINGRGYDISCDDGQETHLFHLAEEVDRRVASLVASVGQIGDARLFLLASLLLADQIEDLKNEVAPVSGRLPSTFCLRIGSSGGRRRRAGGGTMVWPNALRRWFSAWPRRHNCRDAWTRLDNGWTVAALLVRSLNPSGQHDLEGAVPAEPVGSAYGAHLRKQAREDHPTDGLCGAVHAYAAGS